MPDIAGLTCRITPPSAPPPHTEPTPDSKQGFFASIRRIIGNAWSALRKWMTNLFAKPDVKFSERKADDLFKSPPGGPSLSQEDRDRFDDIMRGFDQTKARMNDLNRSRPTFARSPSD